MHDTYYNMHNILSCSKLCMILLNQERLTGDLKVVGSSPAWELRYFSDSK